MLATAGRVCAPVAPSLMTVTLWSHAAQLVRSPAVLVGVPSSGLAPLSVMAVARGLRQCSLLVVAAPGIGRARERALESGAAWHG